MSYQSELNAEIASALDTHTEALKDIVEVIHAMMGSLIEMAAVLERPDLVDELFDIVERQTRKMSAAREERER